MNNSKYKSYPKYKDSGVEWLGEIPEEWEERPLKYLGTARNGLTYSPDDIIDCEAGGTLVLRSSNVQNKRISLEDNVFVNKQINEQLIVKVDDILICSRNGSRALIGKNALIDEDSAGFAFGAFMMIYRSKFNRYLFWVFNSSLFEYQSGTFLTATINQLTVGNINSFQIPLPSCQEQRTIAAFLDHETGKIDELICKHQDLIALLEEKRQAVISHAVTKGLDPNAPMKDSGVEWLGEVPEHWVVAPLKRLADMSGGYAFNSNDFVESGTQLIKISGVYQNRLSLERQPTFLPDGFVDLFKLFVIRQGDVIMSLTGTLGKRDYGFAVLVDQPGPFLLNQRVAKIVPNGKQILPTYLIKLLHSDSYLDQLYSLPSGTKQANLSNDDVLNIKVGYPLSLNEQETIANFVDEHSFHFDKLIAKAKSAIELMQERRTALISAAVTGKIDVRGWEGPKEGGEDEYI